MSNKYLSNSAQTAVAASTPTDDVNELQNLALQLFTKYAVILLGFPVDNPSFTVEILSELMAADQKWYVTGFEIKDGATRIFKVLNISLEFSEAKAMLTLLQTDTSGAGAFLEQLFAGDQEIFGSDLISPYPGVQSLILTGVGNDTVHGGC